MSNQEERAAFFEKLGRAIFREAGSQAGAAVSRAIQNRQLAQITEDVSCFDCGRPATEYEHRDYGRPLDVVPVCRPCNLRRGAAKLDPEWVVARMKAGRGGRARIPEMAVVVKDPKTPTPEIAHLDVPLEGPPNAENGKVIDSPGKSGARRRSRRRHLTPDEVERLMAAASKLGRHRHRDQAIVLLMYRHGLRCSELVSLQWHQVDLRQGLLHVSRLKHGVPSTHPLRGVELRALRKLQREAGTLPYVFVTERHAPLTTSTIRKMLARAGLKATLGVHVHPHMLRHACGYKLANDGQDTRAIQAYLGHRNITHTVRYTELAPGRFRAFWKD